MSRRAWPLIASILLLATGCGGSATDGRESAADAAASAAPNTEDDNASAEPTSSEPDPIAGVDLASAPEPPQTAPGSAAVTVDGVTTDFDGVALGVGQCEVSDTRIAVRIGQSGPWLAFEAQRSGDVWTQGPSWQPAGDPPQHEGTVAGGEIVVDGATVTFRGEVVVKQDPIDFDSWERTVGALTIDCSS